jgi:NADH:ubiquinone oxidoreductase subunit 3 (subunit A)
MKKVRLMTIWMHVKMLKIPKKIKTHKQQEKKTKKYESQVVKG